MANKRRRPSLLSAIIWLCLGGLFLLQNFGIGPDVWRTAARYWPVLLILLGLGKVIDYFRRKDGVSLRFGEVFGIFMLVLFGAILTKFSESGVVDAFRTMPIHIGNSSVRPGQWFGTSHRYMADARYTIGPTTPLKIENSYGNVVLLPGSDGEVRVRLTKVVYQNDENRARQIASEIKIEGGPEGGAEAAAFLIRTNRDSLSQRDYRFNTELEVIVPPKAQVQLRNSFGEVRAANLAGALDLATTHNSLEVRDHTGNLTISNRYADSRLVNVTGNVNVDARGRVYIETVKGDVVVRNEYSPTEVEDIQGTVSVVGTEGKISVNKVAKAVVIEGRGSDVTVSRLAASAKISASHRRVQVEDVTADVSLQTQYSNVNIKDVRGTVDIASNSDRIVAETVGGALKIRGQGTSVNATGVKGAVEIASTLKDVVVNDFEAACKVTNEYGDVTLSTGKAVKGDVSARNRNGSIEIFLPAGTGFLLDAVARNGRVATDFPKLEPKEGPSDSWTLKAHVGAGGPKVQLETDYSNINISTREPEEEPEAEQSAPRRHTGSI
jgi:hypothetical protein